MKMFYGKNASGNVKEAVNGLRSPQLIVFTSSADRFEKAVADVEALFPGASLTFDAMSDESMQLAQRLFPKAKTAHIYEAEF